MTDPTNAISPAYVRKQFDLLSDRDPIEVLSQTADRLRRIVRDNAPEVLRCRPFEGKWTPNEILGHLLDCEWIFGFRIRHIFCEPEPLLVALDQDAWVDRQRHNDREPDRLVESFAALRPVNIDCWRSMSTADLKRNGRHGERGPESLGFMLRLQAGHDLSHLDQIDCYLAAIEKREA